MKDCDKFFLGNSNASHFEFSHYRIPGSDDSNVKSQTPSESNTQPTMSSNTLSVEDESVTDFNSKLMVPVGQLASSASHKVTVVGAGAVGMACAFSILTQVMMKS